MKPLVVCTALVLALAVPTPCNAQDDANLADFSITLKRVGCVGSCPDYEVTILGNGRVRYQGNAYVRVEGVRERVIPVLNVQKLVTRLQNEHFFQWDETDAVCLDFPEVHITASVRAHSKHVLEGCNKPGKVLTLAKEIDRISGTKRWVKMPR
jgi:hypothetical protein